MKARLKEIGADPLYADERAALEQYADLLKQQSDVNAKRKDCAKGFGPEDRRQVPQAY